MSEALSFDSEDAQAFVDTMRPVIPAVDFAIRPNDLQTRLLEYVAAGRFGVHDYFEGVRAEVGLVEAILARIDGAPQIYTNPVTGLPFSLPMVNGQPDYSALTPEQLQIVLEQLAAKQNRIAELETIIAGLGDNHPDIDRFARELNDLQNSAQGIEETVTAINNRLRYESALDEFEEELDGEFEINPVSLRTIEELDARIAEVEIAIRLSGTLPIDQREADLIEYRILNDLRDQLVAAHGDLGFLITPANVVDRNTRGPELPPEFEQHRATFEDSGISTENPDNDRIRSISDRLSAIQVEISQSQITDFINSEHDYSSDESLARIIAVTAAILGQNESGGIEHTASDLGLDDTTFVTATGVNATALNNEYRNYVAGLDEASGAVSSEMLTDIALLDMYFQPLAELGRRTSWVDNAAFDPDYVFDEPATDLYWWQLQQIRDGDHLGYNLLNLPEDEYTPARIEAINEELQRIASILLENPDAFDWVVGASSGTAVLRQGEINDDPNAPITRPDINGFNLQNELRYIFGDDVSLIDGINTDGDTDGTVSDDDLSQWLTASPHLPTLAVHRVNQAIDLGLTDEGGLDKLQDFFADAGLVVGATALVVGSISLVPVAGGFAVYATGLGYVGTALGAAEAITAVVNEDSEAAFWAASGVAFDFVTPAITDPISNRVQAQRAWSALGEEGTPVAGWVAAEAATNVVEFGISEGVPPAFQSGVEDNLVQGTGDLGADPIGLARELAAIQHATYGVSIDSIAASQ